VLDPEVTWTSDGGGAPGIARKPIHGPELVARFVLNLERLAPESAVTRPVEINGGPGAIIYVDGRPFTVLTFAFEGGRIKNVYAVANPDKLATITVNNEL
jgi:RNA polymerase sigma-70 factor (ECF subfamily)